MSVHNSNSDLCDLFVIVNDKERTVLGLNASLCCYILYIKSLHAYIYSRISILNLKNEVHIVQAVFLYVITALHTLLSRLISGGTTTLQPGFSPPPQGLP